MGPPSSNRSAPESGAYEKILGTPAGAEHAKGTDRSDLRGCFGSTRLYGVFRVEVGVVAHGLRRRESVLGIVGERIFVVLDHRAFVAPFVLM